MLVANNEQRIRKTLVVPLEAPGHRISAAGIVVAKKRWP
jgi:hypothetical protein